MKTPYERFKKFVDKNINPGCWIWKGCKDRIGYGRFDVKGKHLLAHRFIWEHFGGKIPKGMCILHKCDSRPCVRPYHLFLGTQADNVHDAMDKGRHPKGEKSGRAKMTTEKVLWIRSNYRHRYGEAKKLCAKFGISYTNFNCIINRLSWKHI